MLMSMGDVMFRFELKRNLLLMELENKIGKILEPAARKMKGKIPKGKIYYLDY